MGKNNGNDDDDAGHEEGKNAKEAAGNNAEFFSRAVAHLVFGLWPNSLK